MTPRAAVHHGFARPLGLRILLATNAAVAVGVDVARPEVLVEQIVQRPTGAHVAAEVHHYWNVGGLPDLLRIDVRRPFRPGEVRAFDPDDQPLIFVDRVDGRLHFHVHQVLLSAAFLHAHAHDVKEGQHAGLLRIDDALLEVLEAAPSARAGIGRT